MMSSLVLLLTVGTGVRGHMGMTIYPDGETRVFPRAKATKFDG